MNFFTSDHHFYHNAVLWMCKRPYTNMEEMIEDYVAKWNSKVRPTDHVYHLGDIAHKANPNKVKEVLYRLNGTISLVKGNHDKLKDVAKWKDRFDNVYQLPNRLFIENLIEIEDEFIGKNIVMCHYPIVSWRGQRRGTIHVHGHCHGNLKLNLGLGIDAGVDCHNGYPLSSLEIFKILDSRPILSVDHHE